MARLNPNNFEFKPTIAPLPQFATEEYGALVKDRIQLYDEELNRQREAEGLLATMPVAGFDAEARNVIAKSVEDDFNSLSERYSGAYESPEFQRASHSMRVRHAKDPRLITLAQNKANYDYYVKRKQELGALGLDFTDPNSFVQDDPNNPKNFDPQIEQALPWDQEANLAVEPLEKYLKDTFKVTPKTIDLPGGGTATYLETETGEVFDIMDNSPRAKYIRDRIREDILPSFMENPAGNQYYRKVRDIDLRGADVEDKAGTAKEAVYNLLLSKFDSQDATKHSISLIDVNRPDPTKTGGGGTPEYTPLDLNLLINEGKEGGFDPSNYDYNDVITTYDPTKTDEAIKTTEAQLSKFTEVNGRYYDAAGMESKTALEKAEELEDLKVRQRNNKDLVRDLNEEAVNIFNRDYPEYAITFDPDNPHITVEDYLPQFTQDMSKEELDAGIMSERRALIAQTSAMREKNWRQQQANAEFLSRPITDEDRNDYVARNSEPWANFMKAREEVTQKYLKTTGSTFTSVNFSAMLETPKSIGDEGAVRKHYSDTKQIFKETVIDQPGEFELAMKENGKKSDDMKVDFINKMKSGEWDFKLLTGRLAGTPAVDPTLDYRYNPEEPSLKLNVFPVNEKGERKQGKAGVGYEVYLTGENVKGFLNNWTNTALGRYTKAKAVTANKLESPMSDYTGPEDLGKEFEPSEVKHYYPAYYDANNNLVQIDKKQLVDIIEQGELARLRNGELEQPMVTKDGADITRLRVTKTRQNMSKAFENEGQRPEYQIWWYSNATQSGWSLIPNPNGGTSFKENVAPNEMTDAIKNFYNTLFFVNNAAYLKDSQKNK